MSGYSCTPCMKSFSGIKPYENHMASRDHKEKVNDPTPILEDFTNYNFNSPHWEQEPFLYSTDNGYKCTLCSTSLNSRNQVKCHIRGAKHLKAKGSSALHNYPTVFPARKRNIDQVDGNSLTLPWEQEPFIYSTENGYKCTLCRTSLNSVNQVQCHIRGAKHLKAKGSSALRNYPTAFTAREQNIDQVDHARDSRFQLYNHIDEAKRVLKSIKTFKPDEEIVFNTK